MAGIDVPLVDPSLITIVCEFGIGILVLLLAQARREWNPNRPLKKSALDPGLGIQLPSARVVSVKLV